MKVTIEEEGRGLVRVFQDIPASMRKYVYEQSTPVGIAGDHFKALFQEFKGDGFCAWHNSYWMTRPVVLKAKGSESILELRIALRGMIRGTWDKIKIAALPVHHFQMGFTPHVLTRAIFDLTDVYETFDIHFELEYLESLGFNYKQLDQFINRIKRDNQAELSDSPHHCTPRMMDHVMGILRNHYSPEGKHAYLKQAVETILFEALEEVCRAESMLPELTIQQVHQMHDIKALIEADCPDWRGEPALCQAAGINGFYFYVWFKQLFGVTPHEHYTHMRFMLAKKLLLEGESAANVSAIIGYSSPASFGTEFKKHFGYTPKQYQQGRL